VRPGSGVCSTLQVLLEPGGLAHGWGDKPLVNGAVNGRWMEREWGVQVFSIGGVVNGAPKSFPSTMIRDVLFWPQESMEEWQEIKEDLNFTNQKQWSIDAILAWLTRISDLLSNINWTTLTKRLNILTS
jgi:hypothetical protein